MTNLFKKFTGGFSSHLFQANPARDWWLLLGACALALVASVVWNTWFFDRVVDEGVEAADSGTGTLDAYESSSVKTIFDAREAKSAAYRSDHVFIDPSR